jgi:hypothetical protein
MERVAIPYEGKEIIGYLRKPEGATRPPVVITTGGVDVYKEERGTNDILGIGAASFSMDMPGGGECPQWNTPDAEKLYIATIEYLLSRADLDGKRMGFMGRSYAGYWASKMAYVESKRLKACINGGGPVHVTWQKPWLTGLLNETGEDRSRDVASGAGMAREAERSDARRQWCERSVDLARRDSSAAGNRRSQNGSHHRRRRARRPRQQANAACQSGVDGMDAGDVDGVMPGGISEASLPR